MKRFITFLLAVMAIIAMPVLSQVNADFYWHQPDDWNYTPNQAQVDLHFSSAVDFYQLSGFVKITLQESDGLLKEMLPSRFPKRDTLIDITDSSKWSFVNLIEKLNNNQGMVYSVRYVDSNRTDGFFKGHDIIMLEEFIRFTQWPTYGKLIVELYDIKIINVNNMTLTANVADTIIINFGNKPEKQRPKLDIVFPDTLKTDTKMYPIDFYLTNVDYTVTGIYVPDIMLNSCLVLDSVENTTSKQWTAIMSQDSIDSRGNSHYGLASLPISVSDFFQPANRRRILRVWFKVTEGCLSAGDLVDLAWYGALVTDNSQPIKSIDIDDYALTIQVVAGKEPDPPCPKGDINLDSLKNLDDVILFLQYLVNITELNSIQQCAADIDSNSRLNLVDGVLMIRALESPFGIFQIIPKNNLVYLDGAGALIIKGNNLKQASLELTGEAYKFVEYSRFLGDTAFILKFNENYRYYGNVTFNDDALIISGYQITTSAPSSVEDEDSPLKETALPNPFTQVCRLNYYLPYNGQVNISVYNNLGEKVANILSEKQSLGQHQTIWEPQSLPTGAYYYQITVQWLDGADITINNPPTGVYVESLKEPPYISGGTLFYFK